MACVQRAEDGNPSHEPVSDMASAPRSSRTCGESLSSMWQEAEANVRDALDKLKDAREADFLALEVKGTDEESVAKSEAVKAWDVAEKAVVRAEETIALAIQKSERNQPQKRKPEDPAVPAVLVRSKEKLPRGPRPPLKVRFRPGPSMSVARIIGHSRRRKA